MQVIALDIVAAQTIGCGLHVRSQKKKVLLLYVNKTNSSNLYPPTIIFIIIYLYLWAYKISNKTAVFQCLLFSVSISQDNKLLLTSSF